MSTEPKESRIPWYLLFSRTGRRPEEVTVTEEEGIQPAQEPRSMSEKEGRNAFLFWMVSGFVLCLLVALGAISCGRKSEVPADDGSRALMIVILAAALFAMLAIAVFDFVKAWKAQNKKTEKKSAEKQKK